MIDTLIEGFVKHQGVDVLAQAFLLSSAYFLGNGRKYGFLLAMAASVTFVVFGLMIESHASVLANIIFFFLNLRGFLRWDQKNPQTKAQK
jgi:nicotinamide riboside transporter PnuC